jgi:hypothetical protein
MIIALLLVYIKNYSIAAGFSQLEKAPFLL